MAVYEISQAVQSLWIPLDRENFTMKQATRAAHKLFHDGADVLSQIEENGMRIDVAYLDATIESVTRRAKMIEGKLRECEEFRLQRREFGERVNLASRQQLARVLFDVMGHESHLRTDTGRVQLNETALEKIDSHYTRGFLKLEKLKKVLSTNLIGLKREVCNGYIHPMFDLNTVRSYRGSSSRPNAQNIPKRNAEQVKLVRRAFIPRKNHVLVETDYSTLEVRVACCLSGDEKLTYDTVHGDMHRDMAAECYMLDKDDVTKDARFAAKGGFVFAEFYGDWYKACARNLWDACERDGITTKAGIPMLDHLASVGIDSRGSCEAGDREQPRTFEYHLKQVEDRFWNVRFKGYGQWRIDQWNDYQRRGYLHLVTGFLCHGVFSRNQVTNYPVQGPAFHCLLWSLIQLVKRMSKMKMRSKVISQVHDSILGDIHKDELDDYKGMVKEITTEALPRAWKWITVKFSVEAEIGEENWYAMKELAI